MLEKYRNLLEGGIIWKKSKFDVKLLSNFVGIDSRYKQKGVKEIKRAEHEL